MKKTHELRIRISQEEYERLKRISDKLGLSISEVVRITLSEIKISYKNPLEFIKE